MTWLWHFVLFYQHDIPNYLEKRNESRQRIWGPSSSAKGVPQSGGDPADSTIIKQWLWFRTACATDRGCSEIEQVVKLPEKHNNPGTCNQPCILWKQSAGCLAVEANERNVWCYVIYFEGNWAHCGSTWQPLPATNSLKSLKSFRTVKNNCSSWTMLPRQVLKPRGQRRKTITTAFPFWSMFQLYSDKMLSNIVSEGE